MKKRAIATIMAVLVLIPLGVEAQSKKDPSAVAVLSQAAAALGGQIGNVKTVRASGTYVRLVAGGKTATYDLKMTAVAPDRIRWDVAGASGNTTSVIVGNSGWILARGKRKALAIDELTGNGLERFPLLLIPSLINDANINLADAGMAVGNGISFREVTATRAIARAVVGNRAQVLEQSTQIELYLDPQTGLPVWVRYYQNPIKMGKTLPVDLLFSDLRNIAGVVVPMTVAVNFGTQCVGVLHFEDIKVNVAVTPEEFKE